jgi:hypothetical protein
VFLLANDVTANSGRRWGCRECIILASPGSGITADGLTLENIPEVLDRGAKCAVPFDGTLKAMNPHVLTAAQRQRSALSSHKDDLPVPVADVQVRHRQSPVLLLHPTPSLL